MKRIFSLLILVPVGIVIIALSVANRQSITVSIPPQVGDAPLYAFDVPLYALLFATLFVGMLLGSFATWVSQGRHRKEAREQKLEATKLTFEADKIKAESDTVNQSSEVKALAALGLSSPSKAA